jgi:hypothetical protein
VTVVRRLQGPKVGKEVFGRPIGEERNKDVSVNFLCPQDVFRWQWRVVPKLPNTTSIEIEPSPVTFYQRSAKSLQFVGFNQPVETLDSPAVSLARGPTSLQAYI